MQRSRRSGPASRELSVGEQATLLAAAFADLQRLPVSKEAELASWVQIQADLGLAPTHQQVKRFAQRILYAMVDTQPLGKR
ncbi:hypothetical protein CT0861_06243 [Colletotrichum tofieldiae]|uniref:HTH CENPB-type domain-containing protein n=1 Tax=Colletotrichum tofieldiae TaxID=708197 RepID=A0A166N7B9_9PEZI|nr:hypothetical protein CT0861_06243 [Colletotrichum tofieldiae]